MTEAAIPHRSTAEARPVSIGTLLLFAAAGLALYFGGYELLESYFLVPRMDMRTLHLLHIVRGITGSVLLAGFVAWYLIRHAYPGVAQADAVGGTAGLEERNREHVRWFVRMRWIAAGFTLALIIIAVPLTGILSVDYLPRLLFWWALLMVANAVFAWDLRSHDSDFDRRIMTQIVVDLIVLTGLLNASGGIENPLAITYLFHVIIAGILLPKEKALGVAAVASVTFSCLAFGELFHVLPHTTILLFPHAHVLRAGHMHMAHAAHDPVFATGHVVSFVAVMFLTSYFTTLVAERLRRSESSLEVSARRAMLDRHHLEGVIDAAGLGIAMVRNDGALAWANQRLTSWMGWPSWSAGAECRHEHDDGAACVACAAETTIASGTPTEHEVAVATGGGAMRYFRHVTSPVRDADGHIVEAVEVVEEVTARKALEAEALHAGRLSILGQLASGIAHEIGNPLSSLQARLELMRRRDDPAYTRDSLQVVQAQIDRIGRIVRGVSHLSRNRREGWVTVDVNAVLAEALSLVKLDSRAANIRFEESLQETLTPIRGVRDQMLQVVINLLLNAVEAMPGGGTLSATTSDANGHVEVSIRDSGSGLDATARAHLFEPFFTTKPEGTGLGLSICYTLVHAHGGTIEVTSEPGQGACFTIALPRTTANGGRSR